MTQLKLYLSGTFDVRIRDARVTGFRTDKARAMLAYLAVEADTVHRRSALGALLWGELGRSAALANVRNTLSNLKQLLAPAPGVLTITRQTVTFHAAHAWVDVVAFAKDPPANVRALRGPFLHGLTLPDAIGFEEWQMLQAERLHLLQMKTLDTLQQAALKRAAWEDAVELAQQQLFLEAWHEPAYRTLLRALIAQGQRSSAEAQFERLRTVLRTELGVEPSPETQSLWHSLQQRRRTQPTQGRLPPALTPFFGREAELQRLNAALAERHYRLLTITGPGGSGKTRLALEAARRQRGAFADGAWFVPLAQITVPDAIVPAIGDAIGLQFGGGQPLADQLHSALRRQDALLVLDNLEQMPAAADVIAALLHATEQLVVIATSRRRLQLRIERRFPLEGLPFPPPDVRDPAAISRFPAVQFLDEQLARVGAVTSGTIDRSLAAELCRLVGGLPLGLELVAAQTEQRAPAQVAAAVQSSMDILQTEMRDVPPRQRSLRAVFDTSWELLAVAEKELLCRLPVFHGDFDREAVAAVTDQVSPRTLDALVQHSLVRVTGEDRFALHETMRGLAAEKASADIITATHARHSRYFLGRARQLSARWHSMGYGATLAAGRRDGANITAAWEWAVARADWPEVARSAEAVRSLYRFRVLYAEGAALFARSHAVLAAAGTRDARQQRVLGRLKAAEAWFLVHLRRHGAATEAIDAALAYAAAADAPALEMDVRVAQQIMLTQQDDFAASLAVADRLRDLASAHGNPRVLAHANVDAGFVKLIQGEFAAGRDLLREAEGIYRAQGDIYGVISALNNLGLAHMCLGEMETAETRLQTALQMARERADREREFAVISALGSVYYNSGDYGAAAEAYARQLTWTRTVGLPADINACLVNLGLAQLKLGRYAEAARHLEEAVPRMKTVESQANYCAALLSLCGLRVNQDDLAAAERLAREALTIARENGLAFHEGNAYAALGRVHLAQGAAREARTAFAAALTIRTGLGERAKVAETHAGLARATLAAGEPAAARDHVAAALADDRHLESAEPHIVLFECQQVLRTMDDPRAAALLHAAAELLEHRANRIRDKGHRASYLNNVPVHASIMKRRSFPH